jgi:hypothetical protein
VPKRGRCGFPDHLCTGKSQGYPTSYAQALRGKLVIDSREKGTARGEETRQYQLQNVRLFDPGYVTPLPTPRRARATTDDPRPFTVRRGSSRERRRPSAPRGDRPVGACPSGSLEGSGRSADTERSTAAVAVCHLVRPNSNRPVQPASSGTHVASSALVLEMHDRNVGSCRRPQARIVDR